MTYLLNLGDLALKSTVVNENFRAHLHCIGQLAVVCRNASGVTFHCSVRHDHESLSCAQLDRFSFFEGAGEHGWALGIEHNRQLLLPLSEDSSQGLQRLCVRLLQFQFR